MPWKPCEPGCQCGIHQRSPEHNARIGASGKRAYQAYKAAGGTGWGRPKKT